ncbi:MAG: endolytic transglycosylase MltG, partial [Methylococcaceae bacterium]|nr:endolytic transglycosylase MltG [Methylococcaceae bacterium]
MKFLLKTLVFLLFLSLAVAGWGWMEYQAEQLKPVVNKQQFFDVKKGDSVNKIIYNLQAKQIKVNFYWFKVMAYEKKLGNKLKAGEYELKQGMTTPQLLALFVSGKSRQYSITFPEGWAFKQIRQKIAEDPYLQQTLADVDNETLMAKLNSDYKHPEGLFFPDTYFFDKNTTDFILLKRAYNKMQKVLEQEWQAKEEGLLLKTPYETLILASIIEKETGAAHERPLIAGVFTRRLKIGMKLQTDPTIIYGMGDRYKGNIRYKDLREATPYNTYVINGLPPTPIAMPGKEAIHAALHPAKGDSLYFVSRNNG